MKKTLALVLTLTFALLCFASCKPQDDADVSLKVLANHDVVAAQMALGQIDVAILPEPKATVAINAAKAEGHNYSIKLNLSEEWDKVSENGLAMGCIIAKSSFVNSNRVDIDNFLAEYEASINYINNPENKASAAQMIVSAGILPKLPIANAALDNLYGAIVYQDGDEMKETLTAFYDAIDLKQPLDSFYYTPENLEGASDTVLRIGVINGPTGMGMAKLISDNDGNNEKYSFSYFTQPEQAKAALLGGDIDVACIPTNVAASISNAQPDFINVLSINCLGSLYVVVKDGVEVNSFADLKDKTVYYGVKTSTTEPIFRYIAALNDLKVATEE